MAMFDPGRVLFGQPQMQTQGGGNRYVLPARPPLQTRFPVPPQQDHILPGTATPGGASASQPTGTLASEGIRSSGAGPFDQAYRQNLATYAGGQFSRPGGSLFFNPTSLGPSFGSPTGGGNAPVMGMPNTLNAAALGGSPFSWAAPNPVTSPIASPTPPMKPIGWDWWNSFNGGNPFSRGIMTQGSY